MNILKKNIQFGLLLLVFLSGCETVEHQPAKAPDVFDELESKIATAQAAKPFSSSWITGATAPLKIVGPIFQTGFEQKSPATQALGKVIKFVGDNPDQLDQLAGMPLSAKFSAINVSSFVLGEDEYSYIPAIFNVGYGDESALNAVFNVALLPNEPAEIGFYIDSQAWQNGVVNLQGYKTIKAPGKERNSSWFNYRLDLSGSDSKAKVNALLKMTVYALASDIREFASINRDAVMKFNDKDYVVERANGDTFAYVYKDRLKVIEAEINRKIDGLDKERVLSDTANARSIHVDDSGSYITVNTLNNYVSKVEVLSLQNAGQRTLIWESKQWDEYVKQAFYLPSLSQAVILSDKFLTLRDINQPKVELQLPGEQIHSLSLVENKAQLFFVDNGSAFMLDLRRKQVKPLRALGKVERLLASQDGKGLYVLSSDKQLSYFDAKTKRLTRIADDLAIEGMRICGQRQQLLFWQGQQAFIFDNTTSERDDISFTPPFNGDISSADCALEEQKFALMSADGEVRQFDLPSRQQITRLAGSYDAYDRLNSGYVVAYLPEHEYIYGGKDNLKIRPTTTAAEIKHDYERRRGRVNSARSWLDKSSIQQVVFAEPLALRDLSLYQYLFAAELKTEAQRSAMLAFLNEEQADPLLVANKPSLFNRLSGGITVTVTDDIMVVKQAAVDNNALYTTSVPNWDHLGFKVDTIYLGSAGFEAKIYRRFSNSQLTADIENIALPSNLDMLVTALSNGSVQVESLSPALEFEESFTAHESRVTAADINPSRKLLATAGSDGLIKIWLLTIPASETGWVKLDKELKGYAGKVSHLEFVSDNLLLSSGSDQTIKIWDISSGRIANSEMLGHTDKVRFAKYDRSLQQIISASDDGTVRIWDAKKAEQVRSFKGTAKGFVASYDAGANLVAYSKGSAVLIKNVVSGDTLGTIAFTSGPAAIELGFAGEICYLIYPQKIAVHKVASGELVSEIPLTDIEGIKQVLTNASYQDLFIMTEDTISVVNTGRYALFAEEHNE
jgi:WD40 repeat protein